MKRKANRQPWTAAEDATLCESWLKLTAQQLSQRLPGRSLSSISQRAATLGVQKQPRHPPELIDQVRQLHAAGLNDHEIAVRVGQSRDVVHGIRYARLKLPPNEAAVSAARRRGVLTQQKRLGISSGSELRAMAYREFAAGRGWPEDLRPRAVQILELLAVSPPLCRQDIAAGIGMPWKGSRKSLTSNDPEGSYLAHLIRRGLVVTLPRAKTVRGKGRGRSCHLYTLTPTALEVIQRRAAKCEVTTA